MANCARYRTIIPDIRPSQDLTPCQAACPVCADAGPRVKVSETHLCEVVELFDDQKTERGRLLGRPRECTAEHPCGAHEEWRMVRIAHLGFLEKTIIAEITHRRGRQAIPSDASETET